MLQYYLFEFNTIFVRYMVQSKILLRLHQSNLGSGMNRKTQIASQVMQVSVEQENSDTELAVRYNQDNGGKNYIMLLISFLWMSARKMV